MTSRIEISLADLARELKKRGLEDASIIEEARDHLTDSTERARSSAGTFARFRGGGSN